MESTYFKISRDNVKSLTININDTILSLPSHIKKGVHNLALEHMMEIFIYSVNVVSVKKYLMLKFLILLKKYFYL